MDNNFTNNLKLSKAQNELEVSDPLTKASSSIVGVKPSKNRVLKDRLRTLILERGLTEPQFFSSLKFSRQYWYFISWGLWPTKDADKIRISEALKIDSSVIWNFKKERIIDGTKN